MYIRIIQLGNVSPLRSLSVYRGLATTMQDDSTPILVFLRPNSPFVSVGMHQNIEAELDIQWCSDNALPVIQRVVGGGTVYLDEQQLFFQYIFPKKQLPRKPENIYQLLLQPVLQTYHSLGLTAAYLENNDIQLQGKKLCGTGAATLDNAAVCVGNFIFDFSSNVMANCILSPSNAFKHCLAQLLSEKITTLNQVLSNPPEDSGLIQLMSRHIQTNVGLNPVFDTLSENEYLAIENIESRYDENDWDYSYTKRLIQHGIKISATNYLLETQFVSNNDMISIRILTNNDNVERIWIEANPLPHKLQNFQRATNEEKPLLSKLKQQLVTLIPDSTETIQEIFDFNPY